MPSNSDYAQKQFREDKAERARSEQVEHELRTLRNKVQALERQVASLTTELAQRKVIGEYTRGFS